MGSRVLDPRLASLAEDAEEGVVTDTIHDILSELHLTIQAKHYETLLAGDLWLCHRRRSSAVD